MASHDEDEIGTLSSSSSSSSCSDLNRPSSSALDSDAGREKSSRLVEDSTEGGNDVDSIFDSIAKSEGPKELETCPGELQIREEVGDEACENHYGLCAICLNKIVLQETALIKGCEHAYCVTCILRWATYKEKTTCPQCKHPFESLSVHRSLDGSIRDYMDEESVCLLLRASWFIPLIVEQPEEAYEDEFDYYMYENQYDEDDEDDLNEMYLTSSPNLRIGNRRWGDNGYVRAGRQEARPAVSRQVDSAGPSRRKKEKAKEKEKEKENNIVKENSVGVGRRAKRALKREAADKAAAAKHEQHLLRFGRN